MPRFIAGELQLLSGPRAVRSPREIARADREGPSAPPTQRGDDPSATDILGLRRGQALRPRRHPRTDRGDREGDAVLTIAYHIALPYQEKGHEKRPWFLIRVDAFDGEDYVGYLKIAWVDYDWVRTHYQETLKVRPADTESKTWRWLRDRQNWAYVDFIRVSPTYRRRGIATTLYALGSAWLALNRQTSLHSSSVQSDFALALWKGLKTGPLPIFPVTDGRRDYDCVDFSRTPQARLRARRILKGIPQEPGSCATPPFRTNYEVQSHLLGP